MNGRAYDYNLGRFLSVDSFVQAPGNSQSMNPYSYIMNNPLAGTDPSGYVSVFDKGGSGCSAIFCSDEPDKAKKEKKPRKSAPGNGWQLAAIGPHGQLAKAIKAANNPSTIGQQGDLPNSSIQKRKLIDIIDPNSPKSSPAYNRFDLSAFFDWHTYNMARFEQMRAMFDPKAIKKMGGYVVYIPMAFDYLSSVNPQSIKDNEEAGRMFSPLGHVDGIPNGKGRVEWPMLAIYPSYWAMDNLGLRFSPHFGAHTHGGKMKDDRLNPSTFSTPDMIISSKGRIPFFMSNIKGNFKVLLPSMKMTSKNTKKGLTLCSQCMPVN